MKPKMLVYVILEDNRPIAVLSWRGAAEDLCAVKAAQSGGRSFYGYTSFELDEIKEDAD